MLVRYKTIAFEPDNVKCIELTESVTTQSSTLRIFFRSNSFRPYIKNATVEDFEAVWKLVSGPRGVEGKISAPPIDADPLRPS